jgi:hypothetical protein
MTGGERSNHRLGPLIEKNPDTFGPAQSECDQSSCEGRDLVTDGRIAQVFIGESQCGEIRKLLGSSMKEVMYTFHAALDRLWFAECLQSRFGRAVRGETEMYTGTARKGRTLQAPE